MAQMMEEQEVEEGEICYPDIGISYIDVKLQSVLGHFMKDFEGGVSVENLGPRFGVYGSFLPTYQRPPSVLFQPTTPEKSQNQGTSRATQDSLRFSAQESSKFPVKHEVSMIKSLQTARKSTDLHTGLRPTESGQVSSKFREIPSDSPTGILQTMTSFPVAGGLLLSPLHDKLLTLSRNKKLYDHQQQEVRSSSVEFQLKNFQKNASKECGRRNCCRSVPSFGVDYDISESERDTGEAVSLRKKAVKRVVSHKPYQPRMPHTEKQSFEGKKKLTERQPGSKELTSGDEPPVSPLIIEEDWIRCDKCQKWRLLPYCTKSEQLPESWLCSMLNWLPGMNHCDISEEDTTRALHSLYQVLILNNLQNRAGMGSVDIKAHNGREISVKKRKLRDQDYLMTSQCNGNHFGDSDANAFEREVSGGFRKQKKSKVFQTEKRESSTSKGEEKSRTRGTVTRITPGIKDSPPIDRSTVEREHQTKKYRVKLQSQAEFSMIRKQVCKFPLKQVLGYGKEVRTCIAIW